MSEIYFCPGCPAELVAQSIADHRDLDATADGTVDAIKIFDLGEQAIKEGASSKDAIISYLNKTSMKQDGKTRKFGNLTHDEIFESEVSCMARQLDGTCTLEFIGGQHE